MPIMDHLTLNFSAAVGTNVGLDPDWFPADPGRPGLLSGDLGAGKTTLIQVLHAAGIQWIQFPVPPLSL